MTDGRTPEGRILVVDDDEGICLLVQTTLQREGFDVETCQHGDQVLDKVARFRPDVLLLDLNLPGTDGREICRMLREDPATTQLPILMLTSLGSEQDRVRGFELGTDDYLPKPFSYRELTLRVRALLRRSQPQPYVGPRELEADEVRLEMDRKELHVHGEAVEVTSTEFNLLAYLVQARGRVISRTELLEQVWGTSGQITTRRVDTYVQRLRSKLGEAGRHLHTHRGHGYRFEVEEPSLGSRNSEP